MNNETKTRVIAILVILLITFIVWSLLELSIINDKTNLILEEQNEKQDLTNTYEELLEKYTSTNHELNEYKRVHGELDG